MQHPDEGMIHTWLDGELSPEEAATLEAHAATCEQCRAAIAEARGLIAASSRIVSSLDAVPGGVIPVAKPVKRVWYASPEFRAAAAVLVVAGASLLVVRTGTQKATLAVSSRSEANEASSAQPVMSTLSSPPPSSPAPGQPPAVADQVAGKMESAKPTAPQVTRGFAVLGAGVTKTTVPREPVAKEADFMGKGVRGGAAFGVEDTGVKVAESALKASDAATPRTAFGLAQPELKVVRVDSAATTKKTTYQSLSGSEVVLTEEDLAPAMFKATAQTMERRRVAAAPQNAPVTTNLPAAPAVADESKGSFHSISWVDSLTRHRYSLSGRAPVEELEAIKARLLQTKR